MEGGTVDRNEIESSGETTGIQLSVLSSIPAPSSANSSAVFIMTSNFDLPWSKSLSVIPIEDFSSEVGPTLDIPDSALYIFQLFYTPQFFKYLEVENKSLCKGGDGF